jgi:broad specificity phosphatase PhoE/cyclophilin family peptidyl-prolyl cis-trans isomerase
MASILIATADGALHVSLYTEQAPATCTYFQSLCNADAFDETIISRITKGLLLEIPPSNQQVLNVPVDLDQSHTLTLSKAGIVAIDQKGKIIITLDACEALGKKCFIFGEVIEKDLSLLKAISNIEVDDTDVPLNPCTIFCVKACAPHPVSVTPPQQSPLKSQNSTPIKTPVIVPSTKKRKREEEGPLKPNVRPRLTEQQSSVHGRLGLDKPDFVRQPSVIPDSSHSLRNALLDKRGGLSRAVSTPNLRAMNIPPKYPTRLVIIRHGESEQNAALDLKPELLDIDKVAAIRDADIRLTEKGIWQAKLTGQHLGKTEKFDICFCSPYLRTKQTAEHIVGQFSYPLKVYPDNRLREKEFGRLHGLLPKDVKERFPVEFSARERDGKYWYRFPGGENYPDVEMRISSFIERVSRQYAGRSILIVTHQVPFKLFRAIFSHLDEDGVLGLEEVKNCAIQEYVIDRNKFPEGKMKLKTFNFVSYDNKAIESMLTNAKEEEILSEVKNNNSNINSVNNSTEDITMEQTQIIIDSSQ